MASFSSRRCVVAVGVFGSVGYASPTVFTQASASGATGLQANPSGIDPMVQPASAIVGGLTDGFLGESRISSTERHCLTTGAGTLAAYITQTCGEAVETYSRTSSAPPAPPSAQAYSSFKSTAAASPGAVQVPQPAQPLTQGEETVIAMELAARLVGILDLEKRLAAKCLKKDAVEEISDAAKHVTDATYVGGRLIANGVDIVKELGDAMKSYENKDFNSFGKELGMAWREVVLAKKSKDHLDMPGPLGLQQVTQGLVSGFFGSGVDLQVVATDATMPGMYTTGAVAQVNQLPPVPVRAGVNTVQPLANPQLPAANPQLPATNPQLPAANAQQPVAGAPWPASQTQMQPASTLIDIDVRQCVGNNLPLFEGAWAPVWEFLQKSAQHGVDYAPLPDMTQLLISMLDVQVALRFCGITPVQEAMLFDAMRSGSVVSRVALPPPRGGSASAVVTDGSADVTQTMTTALEDWRQHSWTAFGKQLGDLLRDVALVAFPQKYAVDTTGRLQQVIEQAEEKAAKEGRDGRQLVGAFAAAFGAFAMLSLFVRRLAFGTETLQVGTLDDLESAVAE
eukprot:TRINITY_DN16874_c1_g1_i1.p1 TRINITY_DN16874_c1_g1~~TRINITY_DN16874_c1_g1_i1.p1  ORF type:complete len:567 (-),score=133.04 TRINITY_DN16874_c1_g1_i1:438-2138(-)